MPKIILLLFLYFSISCCSHKGSIVKDQLSAPSIVFIFPETVTQLLKKEVQKEKGNLFFCLYSYDNYYKVIICEFFKKDEDYYAKNSNRYVFLDGKFYSLVMDIDMIFGTTSDKNETLKKYVAEENPLISRSYSINEGYFIKFKKDGEILDSGLGLSKPSN